MRRRRGLPELGIDHLCWTSQRTEERRFERERRKELLVARGFERRGRPCPSCGGDGGVYDGEGFEVGDCPTCEGTGVAPWSGEAGRALARETRPSVCDACRGLGEVVDPISRYGAGTRCRECGGTGRRA